MPKEGADLQFGGVPDSYVPKPFVMQMIGAVAHGGPAPERRSSGT